MKKFHARRLLKLADLIEKIEPNKLNMTYWQKGRDVNDCGTTCCAVGWAGTIPSFKAAGLKINLSAGKAIDGKTLFRPVFVPKFQCDIEYVKAHFNREDNRDENDNLISYSAAQNFFGLTNSEADWLFSPFKYNFYEYSNSSLSKFVSKRIRELVNSKNLS